MRIIIAGCGKIGTTLTRRLTKEGHDVTVIDIVPQNVNELMNTFDVQGIYGSAADPDVLQEAQVNAAHLFIAVTASDELNMIACLFARRLGAQHTIARIRNTEFTEASQAFMRQELQLSVSLNPEEMAARQLFNILKLPSVMQIETFSNRNIEMVQLKVKAGSALDNVSLIDLRKKYRIPFLICTVERGDAVYIPDGNFVLRNGDKASLVSSPADLQKLLKKFDLMHKQARSIMILGGSRTAFYLAKKLSFIGNSIKIIDKNAERCHEIARMLPGISVVQGDGTHQELLYEEGIRNMDAFIALTDTDEQNILLSVFAASIGVPTVITKVNSDELARIAAQLGLDCVISPKTYVADLVTRYVRAVQNSEQSKIETLYRIARERAEALEFIVGPDFRGQNVMLKDLHLKKNTLIAGLVRDKKTLIPSGTDVILPGDRVIVISAGHTFNDLSDIVK